MPIVSVVIPTYNRAEYLPRAVDSVLEQTITDLEVIIVDGASTDDTESVVKEYSDPRIRYIRHEENRGASAGRNTGIKAAEGAFVAFLDDDDEWQPRKLKEQLNAYEQANESVGVVYTGIKNVDAEGRTNAIKTPEIEGDVTKELLLHNYIGSFSALLVDSETIERTGLLNEQFPSWEDWEYYVRLSKTCQFASVPEALVIRHNSAHKQISDDVETRISETYPMIREQFDGLAAEYGWWFRRRHRGRLLFQLGYASLSHGQYAVARRLLTRALAYDPTHRKGYIYWLSSLGGRYTYPAAQKIKRWIIRQIR